MLIKCRTWAAAFLTAFLPQVKKCLSIKGAEDAINKPHAFEVSTTDCSMFFIADSDKVGTVTHSRPAG